MARRTSRNGRRRSPRPPRGFTLMEVIVAMVLTGVLVTLLLQWLGTMGQLSRTGSDRADPARVVAFVENQFRSDAMAATGCDDQRNDGPLAMVGPDRVGFYLDESGDGHADMVLWVIEGGDVFREIFVGAGGCEFEAVGDRTTVAQGVSAATPIIPWSDGEAVPQSSTADCQVAVDACPFNGIELKMVVSAGAENFPVPLDLIVSLNHQASSQPSP